MQLSIVNGYAGAGSTRAPYAVIMEAYARGVSPRSVDDLVKALGADIH